MRVRVIENDEDPDGIIGVFRKLGTPIGGAQSRDLTNIEWA